MTRRITLSRRGRVLAVTAGVATVIVVAGSASAYWKTTGTGTGTAKVGVGQTIKSVAVTPSSGLLFPSTTANGTLALTITSPVKATVTGIAKDSTRSITSSVAGCEAFIDLSPITGLSILVPANTATTPTPLTNKVRMFTNTPANCQGATFTIPVVLTAQETP